MPRAKIASWVGSRSNLYITIVVFFLGGVDVVLYFHSEKQETFIESQLHHDPASSARKKNAAKSPFKV